MIAGVLFYASLSLLAYVIAGYPLLLFVLARLRARPITKKRTDKSVTIVVPVRNGEKHIARKIECLLALDYPKELMEILVVSDGSTDRTEAIVEGYRERGVRLVNIRPGGKAAALNAALETASGEVLVFTDVRQQLSLDSVRRLVDCFADPQVGVASGDLIIVDVKSQDEKLIAGYRRYETRIRCALSAIDSMLGATGALYAMRKELATPLPEGTLVDDMYLPLEAFFQGYRLIMEPRAVAFDYATSLESEYPRKVRTLAGNYQLLRARPELLSRRNRMLFHFLSYKVGRLLLPYALLGMLVSSPFLEAPLAGWALAIQAAFYGAAALDPLIPERFVLKRLFSGPRTFVVMMAATVHALKVFFVPSRSLWRQQEAQGN